MFIWRGFGIFVLIIIVTCSLIVKFTATALIKDKQILAHNLSFLGVALILSAICIHFLDVYLDRLPPEVEQDRRTRNDLYKKTEHSFFLIPVRFWIYITAGLGGLLLILQWLRSFGG